MPKPARILISIALAGATLSLSACASAVKTRYTRHASTVVAPGPAASDELVLAFGLDRTEREATVVASASTADFRSD
ncbi:MAG: hypothetical protein JSV91_00290 [Phycisphaerales bacterium]|nr:MAG: hypothetical protein JSV91_00290 [Phycisphaerales bacterium]